MVSAHENQHLDGLNDSHHISITLNCHIPTIKQIYMTVVYYLNGLVRKQQQKSRIRETLNLSTDADNRTNAKITQTRFRMGSGGCNPEKI